MADCLCSLNDPTGPALKRPLQTPSPLRAPSSQHSPGGGASILTILDNELPIHDDVIHTAAILVRIFIGSGLTNGLGIEDHQVCLASRRHAP